MKSLLRISLISIFSFIIFNLTGCLSTEYKEYHFKIESDGSGEGTIIFYNLISIEDDSKDVSFKDFGELVSDYIEGTRFEEDNPDYQVTNKELIEQDSVLVGKIEFTFEDFRNIGFFKDEECECSPLMYYIGDFGETFSESNGNYLGNEKAFPVITWPSDTEDIYLKTIVQEDLAESHSLLSFYHTWKESQ